MVDKLSDKQIYEHLKGVNEQVSIIGIEDINSQKNIISYIIDYQMHLIFIRMKKPVNHIILVDG